MEDAWRKHELRCIYVVYTLEPHYNTDFGVHEKSVLFRNHVIMRVLYTGEVSHVSQASNAL